MADNYKCPFCNEIIDIDNSNICPYCGENLSKINLKKNIDQIKNNNYLKYIILTCSVIILLIIAVVIIINIFKHYNTDLSNTNNAEIQVQKAPACDSQEVKDYIIDNFKNNDNWYSYFDINSIFPIEFIPETVFYDKLMNKYSCEGKIIVKAKGSGILPSEFDYSNYYYSANYNNNLHVINKYTKYECNFTYSSTFSEHKQEIYISNCDDNEDSYTSHNSGKFLCESDNCDPIYLGQEEEVPVITYEEEFGN